MAKKTAEPPQPVGLEHLQFARKAVWLGEAPAATIEKAAAEFKVAAKRLRAIQR
jgi:hypothetical protein